MNKAITSIYKNQDHLYPLRKARYKLLQSLLVAASEDEDKYGVLSPACIDDKTETECRKADWVKFYIDALNAGATVSTLPDITSCSNLDTENIEIA